MTDKPILFSAPMVQALLAGWKTQTRRILKPQPETFMRENGEECLVYPYQVEGENSARIAMGSETTGVITTQKLPWKIGDRLWVREAWRPREGYGNWDLLINYPADGFEGHIEDDVDVGDWRFPKAAAKGNVPSIHMPRWASRLTLNVTDVRIQRLQDISEADAMAEGVFWENHDVASLTGWKSAIGGKPCTTAKAAFENLINSINGHDAWKANPWVTATTFGVVKGNVDGVGAAS